MQSHMPPIEGVVGAFVALVVPVMVVEHLGPGKKDVI